MLLISKARPFVGGDGDDDAAATVDGDAVVLGVPSIFAVVADKEVAWWTTVRAAALIDPGSFNTEDTEGGGVL